MGYIVQNQYGVVTVNDEATINEPKEIRFITPEYKDLFKIPDGGHVLVTYRDSEVKDYFDGVQFEAEEVKRTKEIREDSGR